MSDRKNLINSEPDWKNFFNTLEKWHNRLGKAEPAVTEAANFGIGENKPWVILLSTIISLRTKDEVTVKVSRAILERAPEPEALLRLSEEETTKLCYPAGFYKTKAKNLRKIANILIDQYDGAVPSDMEKLLCLPGVGRKTANLVLTEAFDKYGICVDIHVHRISNRLGWLETATPEKTEDKLREILPKRYWKRINYLFVLYGQRVCRPVSPFCSVCTVKDHCRKIGVLKSR